MLKPVRTVFDKPWIPYKNKVEFYLSDQSDFDAPVTTVHGFFFNDNKELLLVEHCSRGWEVPGGHIEGGESFEEAMRRELLEEAQMEASALLQLGYLKKIALEGKPIGCNYPHPLSYCIFYAGMISSVKSFKGDGKIQAASFFTQQDASRVPWIVAYGEYMKAAFEKL